jgi:hypothetical protein
MENLKFESPKETGILMFQFGEDEPIEINKIFDRGEASIKLQQSEKPGPPTNIMFTSKEGQTFKLFIKDL